MFILFLLAGFIVLMLQLATSQSNFWVNTRRTLLRAALVCGVVFALAIGLWSFSTERQMVVHDGCADAVVSESNLTAVTFLSQAAAEDAPPASLEPLLPSAVPALESNAAPAANNTMVLVISGDDIQRLLGEDAANAFVGLKGLKRAYAMIPLPATGSSAMPPAVMEALNPTTLRSLLSPEALHILASTLSKIVTPPQAVELPEKIQTESPDEELVAELDEVIVVDEPPHVLASWISSPGVGQVVVKSEFLEAKIDEEDALRESIVSAFKDCVGRQAAQEFGAAADWQKLVDVSLTDQALRSCILSTDARTEVIQTSEGAHPMQQTYALVQFPEQMEQQVLGQIRTALRENRLMTLCVSVGVLWLAAILFSAACRFSQGGSLLRTLATFPVMALLILPCMLVFAFMVGAMIKGTTFEFRSEDGRIACVIDRS